MSTHNKSYIICTSPRSGSTLLCDLLAATGLAGQANSYFMREHFSGWAKKFDLDISKWNTKYEFDRSYLSAVLKEGTNDTQVFGLRLMWQNVEGLVERLEDLFSNAENDNALFRSAFGPLHYLHLSREDKVEQAISLLKAEQSGLWHVNADGTERERLKREQTPSYDFALILEYVKTLEEQDLAWRNWFLEQKIDPLYITYESLASKTQAVLRNVLTSFSLDPSIAEGAEAKTAKLANNESSEWATRFRRESTNNVR